MRRAASVILAVAGFSGATFAQHVLVMKTGKQWECQVVSCASGIVKYTIDPASGVTKDAASSEIVAFIDEQLLVHTTDICEAVNAVGGERPKKNCASLIRKDNTVVKGDIIGFMDGYVKIRTVTGEKNEPDGMVGQMTSELGVVFENPEYARKLMADPAVVRAINDMAQCPSDQPTAKVALSPAKAKTKFDAAKKKAALDRKAAPKPKPEGTVVLNPPAERGLLEELDFDTFKTIAMAKVQRLETYIIQLTDGKLALTMRDKVVGQACDLFENAEVNTIQVSSLLPDGQEKRNTHKIAEYLRVRLKFFKYDKVKIKWADMNYASDFEEQVDGSWTAVISIQQQFTGYIDGQVTYSDVTNKNVTVTIRPYDKFTEEGYKKFWDVFLGDIGVSSTQPG